MSNGNYFAQYTSPNIVLVPTTSYDRRSIPDTDEALLTPCNLACCGICAAQAAPGYSDTAHSADPNNLNYFHTVYNNYNVDHVNIVNTTGTPNANLMPPCSHFGSIQNTVNNAPLKQPTFQDYSWTDTNPIRYSDNLIDSNMYATPSTNTIKIKLKEKNENHTKLIKETKYESGLKDIVHVNPQNNNEKLCKTDMINEKSKDEGTNLEIGENCDMRNDTANTSPQDKREKLCKPTTNNNGTSTNKPTKQTKPAKTKNKPIPKEQSKVTKPKTDMKYLWKRHCAKLKDKIKEEIEGSEDMKTQLHTQWKAILRSEYNTFVNNFYRAALISKNKMKSVIANNKLKLNKKPNRDLKNKTFIPNSPTSSSSNTKFTQDHLDSRFKSTHSFKNITQAPKRAYLHKQYENVDLRTLLSSKRNQNVCYEPQRRMPKRPRERENLIITVNQNVETNTQKPIAMEPKPKKKCKKIKLVINVVCNDSDSEEDSEHTDNDHCAMLNEDLSFLDDINVDDIVDSLNCDNLIHDNKISTKEMCTDENINNDSPKAEAIDEGVNEPCLNKPDKMDTTESSELGSAEENVNADCRLPNENSDSGNYKEVYISDTSVLREINDIKNEFMVQKDEEQYVDNIETESANQSIENKTVIFSHDETKIKCENDIVKVCVIENGLDQRKTLTETSDVSTEIKLESGKEKSTPVQIVSKQNEETKDETQDLIEIKSEDEPIIISDDDDENSDAVANIKDVANPEVQEQDNIHLKNEKISLPSENADVIETQEITQHPNENKALVTSVEIGDSEEDIKIQDEEENLSNTAMTTTVQEIKNVESKITEIAKEAVKSIADDEKPRVSPEKPVSIVSNNIPKFKEIAKNKQLRNTNDQEFANKLEKRMFDFLGEPYNIMSIINRGKFSKIFTCTNTKGENFALKVINNVSDRRLLGSLKEKMLMRIQKYIPREQLNLVYLLNSFGMMGYWCFIMEYFPKNLEQALLESKMSFHIDLVQVLARQLVAAVTVLTNNNIIHTDIKPKHILLNSTNDKLKLCGFDDSNYIQYLDIKPNTGTINYRAPEIILGFISDYRIDVWSTALVIFEMATGKKLFPGTFNNDILFKQICTLGKIPNDMKEGSTYKHIHFSGGNFIRIMDRSQRTKMIPYFRKNSRLCRTLFTSYRQDWQSFATKQEVFQDKAKLTRLQQLLEQMLAVDPRYRLPINFVGVNFCEPGIENN